MDRENAVSPTEVKQLADCNYIDKLILFNTQVQFLESQSIILQLLKTVSSYKSQSLTLQVVPEFDDVYWVMHLRSTNTRSSEEQLET